MTRTVLEFFFFFNKTSFDFNDSKKVQFYQIKQGFTITLSGHIYPKTL